MIGFRGFVTTNTTGNYHDVSSKISFFAVSTAGKCLRAHLNDVACIETMAGKCHDVLKIFTH